MSRRITKQLLYSALYLIVLFLIGSGFYRLFLAPTPTCFDGIKNQDETSVDCGGVCGNVCPGQLQPIMPTERVSVFHPTATTLALLVKIQNPNDVAVQSFDYRFDLFDASSTLLKTVRGTSFIYANEIKYLPEFVDAAGIVGATRADFSVENPAWIDATQFERPALAIQDSRTDITTSTITVTGRVANNDTLTLPRVYAVAIMRDRFGSALGVSETELDTVAPGESRAFTITHPAIPAVQDVRSDLLLYAYRP
jgi:hypothetical protein